MGAKLNTMNTFLILWSCFSLIFNIVLYCLYYITKQDSEYWRTTYQNCSKARDYLYKCVVRADGIRFAQKNYMCNRGNDKYCQELAKATMLYDEARGTEGVDEPIRPSILTYSTSKFWGKHNDN